MIAEEELLSRIDNLEARVDLLTKERDEAREDAGHAKHMRKYLSDEMSGWIKRWTEMRDERDAVQIELDELKALYLGPET